MAPTRSTVVNWIVAALAAAALFYLPTLTAAVLAGGLSPLWLGVLVVAALVLVLYVRRRPEPSSRVSLLLVAATALMLVAFVFGLFLTAFANACGDGGGAHTVEWLGAAAIYLVGGAWALQGPPRAVWAMPALVLLGSGWVAIAAQLVPGGDGACFN
jgi:FtsH-binding integral membrane protein